MLRGTLVIRVVLLPLMCGWATLSCGVSSQHLLSPESIARQVGTHYGDPSAAVVRAQADSTDNDGTPMYLMTISGRLGKDGVPASTVTFSALATKLYVWDIRAYDGAGRQVWSEGEWGACRSSCRTGPMPNALVRATAAARGQTYTRAQ